MDYGFVKLPRWVLTDMIKHDALFRVYVYLLGKACFVEQEVFFCGKKIILHPGELVSSVADICNHLGISTKQCRTAITWLKNGNLLVTKTANKGTIFSFTNSGDYPQVGQTKGQTKGKQEGKQRANKGQTTLSLPYIYKKEEGYTIETETRSKTAGSILTDAGECATSGSNDRNETQQESGTDSEALTPAVTTQNASGKPRSNSKPEPEGFTDFWAVYPKKVGKKDARAAWVKSAGSRPPTPELVEIVRRQAQTRKWQEEGGRFIPHPSRWLNGELWNDVVEEPVKRQPATGATMSDEEILLFHNMRH